MTARHKDKELEAKLQSIISAERNLGQDGNSSLTALVEAAPPLRNLFMQCVEAHCAVGAGIRYFKKIVSPRYHPQVIP